MNFKELMEQQQAIQAASGIEIPSDSHQRLQALFAETGELIQALKSDWRWWGHQGKEIIGFSRKDLAFEGADILHFLLVEAIATGFTPKGDDPWAIAWECEIREGHYATFLIEMLTWTRIPQGFHQAQIRYVWAMRKLGFTQTEIEEAYLEKAKFNLRNMGAA